MNRTPQVSWPVMMEFSGLEIKRTAMRKMKWLVFLFLFLLSGSGSVISVSVSVTGRCGIPKPGSLLAQGRKGENGKKKGIECRRRCLRTDRSAR